MDLRDLLESWMLSLKVEHRAANTLKAYRAGVEAYLDWCAREGVPDDLDRGTVRSWVSSLVDAGAEPATANARQSAVKRFSKWLLDEGEQDTDPLATLRPVKMGEKLVEPLTEDEMRALLKAADGKDFQARRDTAILRVLFNTGLRAGEVVALTMEDVDLGAGVITVRKSKTGRGRVAGFGPQTAQALDRYIRMRRTHPLADTPALWLGTRGRGFAYGGLWDALKARAATAGVTRWHPHLARHTVASRWLERGGTEGGLMAVGGWSQRSMMDRYSRATASQRAVEEAKKLNLGDM